MGLLGKRGYILVKDDDDRFYIRTMIMLAVINNNIDIVKELLKFEL